MVAAWVLMFAWVATGGFNLSSLFSSGDGIFSLMVILPFFFIIAISAAALFSAKSSDKIGFFIVVATFIWQLSIALSSKFSWAMFALGIGYFLIGMTMLVGGRFLGGLLANIYPESERKIREWLQTPEADDTYKQTNSLWNRLVKSSPAMQSQQAEQMKQYHYPSSQVVQVFFYSFWSIIYMLAVETVGKDPAFLAPILKDPVPFIFGPFFGFIIIFFACIIIYAILAWRKSRQMGLKLDKESFAIGEQITGAIILKLDKPKQARGLRLEFYGVETTGSGKSSHHMVVCQQSMELSSARLYQSGESIPFTILMPAGVKDYVSPPPTNSMLEKMSRINTRMEWNVKATLDLPGEIDLMQVERIKIVDPNTSPQAAAAAAVETKNIRGKMFLIGIAIILLFIGFGMFLVYFGSPTSAKAAQAPPAPSPSIPLNGYKIAGEIPYGFTLPPMQAVLPESISVDGTQYELDVSPQDSQFISTSTYNSNNSIQRLWVVRVATDNMAIPSSHKIDIYADLALQDGIAHATNFRTRT